MTILESTIAKINYGCGYIVVPRTALDATDIEFVDFDDGESGFNSFNTLLTGKRNYTETSIGDNHILFNYSFEFSKVDDFKARMTTAGYSDFVGTSTVDTLDFTTMGVNDYAIASILECRDVLNQLTV